MTKPTPAKTSAKTLRKNRGNNLILYWFLGISFALIAITGIMVLPLLATEANSSVIIRVPKNADRKTLSDSITKYLGEDYAEKVDHLVAIDSRNVSERFGAYRIDEGESPLSAAKRILRGAQTPQTITINGVRDFRSFIPIIANRFSFPADSLIKLVESKEFMSEYGLEIFDEVPILFLNDSYEFYWTDSPEHVVRKIATNYRQFWNKERLAKCESLGVTPKQLSIIASIVDEETNMLSEKGAIGRLYINRLHKGMKLQADPTVRYSLGDFTIHRITSEHLKVNSPYNTYRIKGLPPGPIRTTSAETLDAILGSVPNDYIYMCAKDDFSGGHNFAITYEEHLENARRYRAALDAAGIK